MNGFLLWANIQRLTRAETEWKEEAVASFLKGEITDAKESLWRVCGDKIALPTKKRQGPSKSTSEVDDIAKALKILAEKDSLPMFMATGDMVKETPITSHPNRENNSEKVLTSLKEMEDTLQTILDSTEKSSGNILARDTSNIVGETQILKDKNGRTVTWADDEDVDLGQGWETQVPRSALTRKDNKADRQGENNEKKGKQYWKDKLNILQGTATGGNHEIPQSADVHLVAYGLGRETTAEQLTNWLLSNGLQVKNCILLTKYEGARSHTFKISIKAADYEKATNPDIWPDKVGVRKYKFFDAQRKPSVLGKSKGSNSNQQWKSKSLDELHKGFLNFHPPTNEQVRQFYESFAPKSSNPGQSGITDHSKIQPGYKYSDATRNGGNATPSFENSVSAGVEQNKLMNNLNMSLMHNYRDMMQNGGFGNPAVNLQNMSQNTLFPGNPAVNPAVNIQNRSQNTLFPYQSAYRAEEGMRGGNSQ